MTVSHLSLLFYWLRPVTARDTCHSNLCQSDAVFSISSNEHGVYEPESISTYLSRACETESLLMPQC